MTPYGSSKVQLVAEALQTQARCGVLFVVVGAMKEIEATACAALASAAAPVLAVPTHPQLGGMVQAGPWKSKHVWSQSG
jgi:hypothetical protein